ncbi:hypothetical protein [Nafulsella turpanensis]|uniref:hypothetical protein n=1 Tax=Nafulsella turpanensis TaxID=1265690 RepID=UPI0003484C11|nr:hypothetical protein [Nafulsella turpanensis]
MKRLFTLSFILFSCLSICNAQKYLPATLHYTDGSIVKMLLKATPPDGKKVTAKASEEANKEKIDSELLSKIIFEEETGPVVYERHALNFGGRVKDKQWVQVLASGPATLYGQGGAMGMMRAGFAHTVTDVTFFAKRTSEENPSFLGVHITSGAMPIGYNKQFRKFAGKYFSDYPALAERIDNKEFKVSDALMVVNIYNQWASKK